MIWWQILIGYVLVLAAFVFMWHRFWQMVKASEPPDCFATDPHPNAQAEYDCRNCPWRGDCLGEK